MITRGEEQGVGGRTTPYLSHSRVSRYLLCPEQYRLYYLENLRPKLAPAALVFGKVLHDALAGHFSNADDPVGVFHNSWKEAAQTDLSYSARESWDKLNSIGQALLGKFIREERARFGRIDHCETPFEIAITGLDLPFVGVIDLLADLDGTSTLVDFKTASSAYEDHEVILSDQLTAYQLAEPTTSRSALCVFVKTKEPRIEWHLATRSSAQMLEFLVKVGIVARDIAAGHFFKRPGKWCSWCDYLPVCTGDEGKARETLVQIG